MKRNIMNLRSKFSNASLSEKMIRYEARKRALVLPVLLFFVNAMTLIVYGVFQLFL
ncbi:MAG: hypothetical protein AAFP76_04595 [Bacteroidota bacterium]